MNPSETDKLLDIGGEIDTPAESLGKFIDLFPYKKNISVINISVEHIQNISKKYPEVNTCIGDACNLPWPDNSFDIVYSNAVIEHVGDYEKQKKMAKEIMRVSKRWFVATPNRWYPFEFHMRLPFVTWLPFHGYLKFGYIVCYDHIKKKYVFGEKIGNLRLLSANQLERCFPGSRIIKQRITFMPETLIVIGSK
jgi:SAM-dependent methyltransferase